MCLLIYGGGHVHVAEECSLGPEVGEYEGVDGEGCCLSGTVSECGA